MTIHQYLTENALAIHEYFQKKGITPTASPSKLGELVSKKYIQDFPGIYPLKVEQVEGEKTVRANDYPDDWLAANLLSIIESAPRRKPTEGSKRERPDHKHRIGVDVQSVKRKKRKRLRKAERVEFE